MNNEATQAQAENEVRELLNSAELLAGSPGGASAEELVARGGRMRRRRRVLVAATALALAGTVVGVSTLIARSTDGSGVVAAPASSGPDPYTTTKPAPLGAPVSAQKMLSTLEHLLPAGNVSQTSGRATNNVQMPSASLVLTPTDGLGAGGMTLSMTRYDLPLTLANGLTCDTSTSIVQVTCDARALPGGYRFQFDRLVYLPASQGLKSWNGYLIAPDGSQVELDEYNAAVPMMGAKSHTGAVPTRTDPPLTENQVLALLTSHTWDAARAALSTPYGVTQGGGPNSDPAGSEILSTINKILPPGVTHSKEDNDAGQTGQADLQIDAGHGSGMLQVTVANWAADLSPADRAIDTATVFGNATQLADGSELVMTQIALPSADGGGVQRVADVLRPDGLRITLEELGKGPVLTMTQLRSLVVNPAWHT